MMMRNAVLADLPVEDQKALPNGRIGPNAVIQLVHALNDAGTDISITKRIFELAGHSALLDELPVEMVDEQIPYRLYKALWLINPDGSAEKIARDAGCRTADYILENRIPGPAKLVLKFLPSRLAAQLLLNAIARNAWTFAGSGVCRVRFDSNPQIDIEDNPFTMPGCIWHVGVFQRLFQQLVSARAKAFHIPQEWNERMVSRFEVTL